MEKKGARVSHIYVGGALGCRARGLEAMVVSNDLQALTGERDHLHEKPAQHRHNRKDANRKTGSQRKAGYLKQGALARWESMG